MNTDIAEMSQPDLIQQLKMLPKERLIELFSELLSTYDTEPLSESDKMLIKEAIDEYNKGELTDWESIK